MGFRFAQDFLVGAYYWPSLLRGAVMEFPEWETTVLIDRAHLEIYRSAERLVFAGAEAASLQSGSSGFTTDLASFLSNPERAIG